MGDDAGGDSTHIGPQRRPAVETEPANPEEHSSDDNVGDVVWSVWQAANVVVSSSLAEHQ